MTQIGEHSLIIICWCIEHGNERFNSYSSVRALQRHLELLVALTVHRNSLVTELRG